VTDLKRPVEKGDSAVPGWEHFSHQADIGVRGYGSTKAEAFEQAALALTAIVTDPADVVPRKEVVLQCDAPDDELLLAEWLNRVIYEMATGGLVFGRFNVQFDGCSLVARAWGEKIDVRRHRPAVEPKGATFTALRVAHEGGRWIAQTVVDV
jgi:SHS2 domain-containing protein